ncbi:MAG: M28 family peptidase [Bacteroidetes bacterium]|nr:M28 family peptidase [Bacteroidota bacterium]
MIKSISKLCIAFILLLSSCSNPTKEPENKTPEAPQTEVIKIASPDFNADSAYAFLKKQVDFGPRVPGTKAHASCASYFQNKLKSYGLKVDLQQAPITTFDGNTYTLKNIFASYKPESKNRILLTAHWDSRPFADEDTKDIAKAIDGANDGASGAAVLLEIARLLSENKPEIGIDIFLNDLEDYGQPDNTMGQRKEDTWCLGTQYWAKNKPADYTPKFGILLDMVGGQNPLFPMEGTSMNYAPEIVQKVWDAASRLGYGNYFISARTGQTTDDHLYLNAIAKIPTIDIVHMDPITGTYPAFHHTHADNISIIEKSTLKMVGQTVMQVIYEEIPTTSPAE